MLDRSDAGLVYFAHWARQRLRIGTEIQISCRPVLSNVFCRLPKFESYGMLETAASVGWKVKDAIVGFHGIGRLANSISRVVEHCIVTGGKHRAHGLRRC
jgi:hypothetical protein